MGIQSYTGRSTLVIFTWEKFIVFTDNKDMWKGLPERVAICPIPFLDNHEEEGTRYFNDNMVNIRRNIPDSITYSYDVNGNGQLSFTFPLKGNHLRFRPDDEDNIRLSNRGYMTDFFEYLLTGDKYYFNYLTKSEGELFGQDYMKECYHKLAPEYIFQPMQPVWLFTLAKDGYWYKNFTGFIQKTQENDTSGKERTLTVSAINILGLFQKVPILHEIYGSTLLRQIMNTEETKGHEPILRAWLGTYFAPKGDSMDTIASYKLEELLPRLIKSINKCYGLVETGPDLKEKASILVKELEATKAFTGFVVDQTAAEKFLSAVEKFRHNRFRIVKEDYGGKLEEYSGSSLRMKDYAGLSGILTIYDLVDKEGNISHLTKGNNFILNTQKLNAFNKLFSQTAQLWQLTYSSVAEIFRKLTTTFIVDFWADGGGNLVIDYPCFNDIPSYQDFNVLSKYKDHTNRYIIKKIDSRFTFIEDGGKLITMMVAPIAYHYGTDLQDAGRMKLTGYSWGSYKQMFNFGLIRKDLSRLFAVFGLTEKSAASIREFGDSVATAFRQRYNSEVFSGTFNSPGRFDLQIGRNILVPHKERTYYIKSMKGHINPGKNYNTTFDISYGKPLWKKLENPWQKDFFIETIVAGDRKKSINYSCYLTEENLFLSFKNCLKNLLMNLCRMTEKNADAWITKNLPQTLRGSVSQIFCMLKQNYPKDVKGIEIDPRLMYTLVKIQQYFTNNKEDIFSEEEKPDNFDWFPYFHIELIDSEYFHDERRKGGKMALIKGVWLKLIAFAATASQTARGVVLACVKEAKYIDFEYRTWADVKLVESMPGGGRLGALTPTGVPKDGKAGNRYADYIFTAIDEISWPDCKFLEWENLKDKNIHIPKFDKIGTISISEEIKNLIDDIDFEHVVGDEVNATASEDVACEEQEEVITVRDSRYDNLDEVTGAYRGEVSYLEFIPHKNYVIYHCNVEHYIPASNGSKLRIATIPIYRDGVLITTGTYFEAIAKDTSDKLKIFGYRSCSDCMNETTAKIIYPKWKKAVESASQKHGIEKALIYAVIAWESGGFEKSERNCGLYDPNKSAKEQPTPDISAGLMHITVGLFESKMKVKGYKSLGFPIWLWKGENCIDMGTEYLAEMKEKYGDDYNIIWAHYNGGTNPGDRSFVGGDCVKRCVEWWKNYLKEH